MNDKDIEQEIQAKGLTAPRVTPEDIEANIVHEGYISGDDGDWRQGPGWSEELNDAGEVSTLTVCVLVLKNGFTVTGESNCASPENFDADIGRKIARNNAIAKVWPLMGYELRSKLAFGDYSTRTGPECSLLFPEE